MRTAFLEGVLRRRRLLLVRQLVLRTFRTSPSSCFRHVDGSVVRPPRQTRTAYSLHRPRRGTYTVKGHQGRRDRRPRPSRGRTAQGQRLRCDHLNADNPVRENVNFGYIEARDLRQRLPTDQNRDKTKEHGRHRPVRRHREALDKDGLSWVPPTDADGSFSPAERRNHRRPDKTSPLADRQTEIQCGKTDSRSQAIALTRTARTSPTSSRIHRGLRNPAHRLLRQDGPSAFPSRLPTASP